MNPKSRVSFLINLLTLIIPIPFASAATRHVPADHATIQSCIDAANHGDECVVAPGTYNELINFLGKAITLRSSHGPQVTTIDGTGLNGSVVTIVSGETADAELVGFTITGGIGTLRSDGTYDVEMGGGLLIVSSSPRIVRNYITKNHSAFIGGGLYLENSSATLVNNVISGNTAIFGAGLQARSSPAMIVNNTITGNLAVSYGNALIVNGEVSPVMSNTIVAYNASEGVGISWYSKQNDTLRNNCFHGNGLVYFTPEDPVGQNGNISDAPKLVGLSYLLAHIQPVSPCIDAGNNDDVIGSLDYESQDRIIGGTVDIGADESDGTLWPTGPFTVLHVSPTGEDSNEGLSWSEPKRTIQGAIDDASLIGGEVWVQEGTYHEFLRVHPFASVFGGFQGDETERTQRDWTKFPTVLDGTQFDAGPLVVMSSGDNLSRLDGFTIANSPGGGISANDCSPVIANNTFINNRESYNPSRGGGILLSTSAARVMNNTFMDNHGAIAAYDFSGSIEGNSFLRNYGGIYVRGSRVARITNNTIVSVGHDEFDYGIQCQDSTEVLVSDNHVSGSWLNNGVYFDHCLGEITSNRIERNPGGGVRLSNSQANIEDNFIISNGNVGGVSIWGTYSPGWPHFIKRNVFVGNGPSAVSIIDPSRFEVVSAYVSENTMSYNTVGVVFDNGAGEITKNTIIDGSQYGIKLNSANALIKHNIVAHNHYGGVLAQNSTFTIQYSAFHNGIAGGDNVDITMGNLRADPNIVRIPNHGGDGFGDNPHTDAIDEGANDDYGDLRLQPGSPCINTGDPNYVPPQDETDLDGHARVLCGRIDMGAYEFGIGDFDCDQSVNLTDVAAMQICFTGVSDEPYNQGCESLDFELDGDVDALDLTTFFEILNDP